mmetsp:Transcript_94180/g.236304  ORF Transcript_94180/g.236304 Transcript_94180/m.236304 type:complete len:431 (+) Transcript_94180:2144-3436(+)
MRGPGVADLNAHVGPRTVDGVRQLGGGRSQGLHGEGPRGSGGARRGRSSDLRAPGRALLRGCRARGPLGGLCHTRGAGGLTRHLQGALGVVHGAAHLRGLRGTPSAGQWQNQQEGAACACPQGGRGRRDSHGTRQPRPDEETHACLGDGGSYPRQCASHPYGHCNPEPRDTDHPRLHGHARRREHPDQGRLELPLLRLAGHVEERWLVCAGLYGRLRRHSGRQPLLLDLPGGPLHDRVGDQRLQVDVVVLAGLRLHADPLRRGEAVQRHAVTHALDLADLAHSPYVRGLVHRLGASAGRGEGAGGLPFAVLLPFRGEALGGVHRLLRHWHVDGGPRHELAQFHRPRVVLRAMLLARVLQRPSIVQTPCQDQRRLLPPAAPRDRRRGRRLVLRPLHELGVDRGGLRRQVQQLLAGRGGPLGAAREERRVLR